MKKYLLFIIVTSFLISCSSENDSLKNENVEIEERIDGIISKMSLEEKVGQMTQITLDVILDSGKVDSNKELVINQNKLDLAIKKYKVGSILNSPSNTPLNKEQWVTLTKRLNKLAIEETGIPLIYGIDAIHGVTYTVGSTFFPQQIGLGATFNRDLAKTTGEITAYETRASNISWNFSPVLGIGIDPRWPRFYETFGEDPFLCAELGVSMIDGYQGDLSSSEMNKNNVIACAKHFYAYTYPKSGKDRTPAWIPDNYLKEYFLPPFQKAIENGVQTLMINSGEINGTPVHMNKNILTDLLKNELKFDGFAVSDWADIRYLESRYHIVDNEKDAVKLAVNAGIDMSMTPYTFDFARLLVDLVNEGEVKIERINDAVRRILRVKLRAGLFNPENFDGKTNYELFNSEEFTKEAFEAAAESITLLENKNEILPFKKGTKLLVVGPNANSMRTLNGGWSYSWQGEKNELYTDSYKTILEAINDINGKSNTVFIQGVKYNESEIFNPLKEDELVGLSKIKSTSKNVDAIVLVIGENSYTETPGDLFDLRLSENQVLLAKEVMKTGKPVVVVLNEGRPRVISSFINDASAVLQTYLPGNYGGEALASILFGDIVPSGKLPYTYPRYVNDLTPYFHKYSDEAEAAINPRLIRFNPQYKFGTGLSYTKFEYSNLTVKTGENLTISVDVKNIGNYDGKESVLLFIGDDYASLSPDIKRLRGFDKVSLKINETKSVSFNINSKDVSFVNANNTWTYEAGSYSITVAGLKQKVFIDSKGTWKVN